MREDLILESLKWRNRWLRKVPGDRSYSISERTEAEMVARMRFHDIVQVLTYEEDINIYTKGESLAKGTLNLELLDPFYRRKS